MVFWVLISWHDSHERSSSLWLNSESVRNGRALQLDDLSFGAIGQSVVTRSAEGFWLPAREEGSPVKEGIGFLRAAGK